VGVHLLDQGGQASFANASGQPAAGKRPTSTWKPGEIVEDRYQLDLSAAARPQTLLRYGVALFRGEGTGLTVLPARAGSAQPGSTFLFGQLRVGGAPPLPATSFTALNLKAGGSFDLVESSSQVTSSGGRPSEVRVVLHWRDLQTTDKRYKVFVHLLDSGDRVIAQDDAEPRANAYPTSAWQANEDVYDVHDVALTSGAPGQLRVEVGLYDATTQERLLFDNGASSVILASVTGGG
jgi:hypothetical protein